MILLHTVPYQMCIVEHCSPAVLARYRDLSPDARRMKAIVIPRGAGAPPPSRTMPDEVPSGGGSGGGAILGGDGAPGSGVGVPGAMVGTGRF